MIQGRKSESFVMLYFVVNLILCIWLSKTGPQWLTDGILGVLVMSLLVLSPMFLAALYGRLAKGGQGRPGNSGPRG
jgi:hypothetical protein